MKVKELLSDETKWSQGAFARDRDGNKVDSCSIMARCWCLTGAIVHCYGARKVDSITRKVSKELHVDGDGDGEGTYFEVCLIFKWNDKKERTFEEVKALVEKLDI